MHSTPIDPKRAAEKERGPQTYGEAVRALRVVAVTSSSPTERRDAQKLLTALDAPTRSTRKTNMAKSYSSPMGDIKKALRKIADDPNDPKHEAAKAALRALGDEDDTQASDDELTADEIEKAVSGHSKGASSPSRGRAKALVNASGVTNLSPYAAQLDEQMGLSARQGTRVEGTQLILSAAKPWGTK
jgi:hypothetical protein